MNAPMPEGTRRQLDNLITDKHLTVSAAALYENTLKCSNGEHPVVRDNNGFLELSILSPAGSRIATVDEFCQVVRVACSEPKVVQERLVKLSATASPYELVNGQAPKSRDDGPSWNVL